MMSHTDEKKEGYGIGVHVSMNVRGQQGCHLERGHHLGTRMKS